MVHENLKQGNDQTVHENLKPKETPDTHKIPKIQSRLPKNKVKHVNLLKLCAILMFEAGVKIINSGGRFN